MYGCAWVEIHVLCNSGLQEPLEFQAHYHYQAPDIESVKDKVDSWNGQKFIPKFK